jgi:hypothetical protein
LCEQSERGNASAGSAGTRTQRWKTAERSNLCPAAEI